jgi:transcription-repair coupling factor (superfamily II helicase)
MLDVRCQNWARGARCEALGFRFSDFAAAGRAPLTRRRPNPNVSALQNVSDSPATQALLAALSDSSPVRGLVRELASGGAVSLAGQAAAAWPLLAALLRQAFPRRAVLVVTADLKQQEWFHQDLQTWLAATLASPAAGSSAPPALFFPAWEILPHEARLPHVDVVSERLECLAALLAAPPAGPAPVITTQALALTQRTFAPAELARRLRVLRCGEVCNPAQLAAWLEAQGYEPEAQVSQKGELARRGGIVDVFPLNCPWPVRIEFSGDTVESLRWFDPITQLSREPVESVTVAPAGELGFLRPGQAEAPATPEAPPPADVSALGTLLDYLPADALVLLCEPGALADRWQQHAARLPPGDPFHEAWPELTARMTARGLTAVNVEEAEPAVTWDEPAPGLAESGGHIPTASDPERLRFESLELWRPPGLQAPEPEVAAAQRKAFFGQLHRWLRQGYAVHVFCNNVGERQRFAEIWAEYGFEDALTLSIEGLAQAEAPVPVASSARPTLHLGALARGFLCEQARLVVVTDAEIFGRYKVQRPRRLKSPHAAATRSLLDMDFAQLEPGDYVVHLQHGIGRYLGLQTLPGASAGEAARECLVLEYAPREPDQPAPKLYVPITEAHLVSKYVGAGKARPPLNTLGGTRWTRAKADAAQAVRDLAADLLSLQAARASQPGFAFPPDTPWQREFESAFLYEETPDQMRAILEAKRDLEAPKPMDRLVCGDVGFGKTEVAIRAAFKAVLAGKQVAVLVPTTVLAQQHFNTFRERMADYPVRVELLSRFRTRREQERVLAALAAGAVDIVVGTHRLLQPDVAFKDLGLVVVDEEQRFGVAHKERLKQLRRLVDVLTLTATPIPRTLYLALTGARDMSTIETPPQDRLPVETIIAAYDERLIRDAIRRELARGGQVFYLHNRIFDIERVAAKLSQLVPEARLVVGHGQMPADDLEEVMTRFVNGEADVLLSTTIIESGIDIPNANTILIDRADRFGLSDLYQLRGRVGRYKHQAYAYLLIPRHAGLLADARKRIHAIKQFSTPGSGFKIAMRDLEIRGAGNLLGREQSGHITAVGFALYCQLLEQSIRALKGETVKPPPAVNLRLDFLAIGAADEPQSPTAPARAGTDRRLRAGLPETYIPEPQHRVELYRRLAQCASQPGLEALRAELRDRFGPLPRSAGLLLDVAGLKLLAADREVASIETREDKLLLERRGDFVMVGGKFPRLTKRDPKARLREIRKVLLALGG